MAIPKVIHYCWFGGNPLPADAKKCIKSWKKYCPDYKIKRWDESNFDVYNHPFTKKAFEAKAWAFVSDYARLKIVHDNGGIYLDTDVELIKSLDPFLKYECYLPVQQNGCYIATGLGFGAERHNSVIKMLMQSYDSIEFDNNNRQNYSCPFINTADMEKIGFKRVDKLQDLSHVTVFPSEYFDPYPSGGGKLNKTDNTVSIHHYSASWTSGVQRNKRKIAMVIGEDKILKMKEILTRIKRGGYR